MIETAWPTLYTDHQIRGSIKTNNAQALGENTHFDITAVISL